MKEIDLVFQQYYRPLCLYALHYLHDLDEVEDVVQDCFVRLLEAEKRKVESPTSFFSLEDSQKQKSFLYAAVRNACIDKLRRKNPIVQDISPSDLSGIISDEQAVDSSSREAELWTAIEQLPERCREIFLMSKRDGMTYREIAEELCLSEKTVEHQISKALKTLRGKYNPQNEMFSNFGTKRYNFKNETQLFKVIPHTSKNQKKSTGFAGTKYI